MSAKFEIGGSASGAVKAVEELNKALNKTGKEAEGAITPTKKVQEAAARLAQQADPQEKYNERMRKLVEAVKGGGLEISKAEVLAKRYGTALDKAGDSGDNAFGSGMLGKIMAMGGGITATLGPLALMKKGFDDISDSIEKAKNASAEARRGMGSLRQLANSDAEFQGLKSKAEALFANGSVQTLDQGAQAVFSLASAGQLDDKSFSMFAGLAQKGVVDPGMLAKAVRQYQSGFGAAETGGAGQIISKAFAASAYSPASVEGLLGASPQMAAAASSLGISDEESLASLAVLSSSVGENVAATQIRAFLSSTANMEGTEGMSIAERVKMVAGKNLDYASLKKTLGTDEATTGFGLLSKNMQEIQRANLDIQKANSDTGAVSRRLGFTDAESDAALSSMMIENQGILQDRRVAAYEELRDGIFERQRQGFRESAKNGLPQRLNASFDLGLSHTQEFLNGYLMSPETFVNVNESAVGSGGMSDQQQAVLESLNRSAKAAEQTAEEIKRLSGQNRSKVTTRQE